MDNKTINKDELTLGIACAELFGGFASLVLTIAWAACWGGFATSVMWAWFVVPLFGLPAVSIAQAYGLCLMLRCLNGAHNRLQPKSTKTWDVQLAEGLIFPPLWCGVLLGVGWIAKAWT